MADGLPFVPTIVITTEVNIMTFMFIGSLIMAAITYKLGAALTMLSILATAGKAALLMLGIATMVFAVMRYRRALSNRQTQRLIG